jgi:hypothetical protein
MKSRRKETLLVLAISAALLIFATALMFLLVILAVMP